LASDKLIKKLGFYSIRNKEKDTIEIKMYLALQSQDGFNNAILCIYFVNANV